MPFWKRENNKFCYFQLDLTKLSYYYHQKNLLNIVFMLTKKIIEKKISQKHTTKPSQGTIFTAT